MNFILDILVGLLYFDLIYLSFFDTVSARL